MKTAKNVLTFNAPRRVSADSLGQAVVGAFGRAADIEELLVGVPVHHMQVPDDVDGVLRGRPARLLLRAGDENGHPLMRIDLHAEIDTGII